MVARRRMVTASRHGVAVTKRHGGVVRPSQLIASVRRTSLEQRGRAVQVGARLGLLIGTMLAAGPSAGGEADLAVRKAEDQCWQDAERLSGQTNLRKMFEDDGDRRIPRRVHGVDPVFPEAVRRPACLRLLHEVLVDSAGRVVKVVIVRRGKPEVACPEFEKAALEAIIHWTYEPYVVSRRAMPFCLTIGTNIDIRAR